MSTGITALHPRSGEGVGGNNVVELRFWLVEVDVVIELFHTTLTTVLCFGKWRTQEEAESWCGLFELYAKELEAKEQAALADAGDINSPFIQAILSGAQAVYWDRRFRGAEPIMDVSPEDAAMRLPYHALDHIKQLVDAHHKRAKEEFA